MRTSIVRLVACLFFILFISSSNLLFAQVKTYAVITDINTQKQLKLEYAVTKKVTAGTLFETTYLISDKNGFPYKAVVITNDTKGKKINISARELLSGKEELSYPYKYDEYTGLIVNELYDTVTVLNKPYNYLYLVSFADTKKEDVDLHCLSDLENYTIVFSSISDEKMKQNKDYLKQLAEYLKLLSVQEEKRKEEEELMKKVDSLVALKVKIALESESIPKSKPTNESTAVKVEENKPTTVSFSNFTPSTNAVKVISEIQKFYERYRQDSTVCYSFKYAILNDVRASNPTLLKNNNNEIYYSISSTMNGNSVSNSKAWILNKDHEYFGGVNQKIKEGKGVQLFKNGSFFIGNFTSDYLLSGFAFLKAPLEGEYFGDFVNFKKTGLGEFKDVTGDVKLGIFKNAELVSGYIKRELFPGNYKYLQVENSELIGEDNQNGEFVFKTLADIKAKLK